MISLMLLELIHSYVRVCATWLMTSILPRIRIVFACMTVKFTAATKGFAANSAKNTRSDGSHSGDRWRNCDRYDIRHRCRWHGHVRQTRENSWWGGRCTVEEVIGSLDILKFHRRGHVGLNTEVLEFRSKVGIVKISEVSVIHLRVVVLGTNVCISSGDKC
jgi:hypothetical protein